MPAEKTRLGLWLVMWGYMVVTLVVPLALATAGVWDWDLGMSVASAFWLPLFMIMAILPEYRPTRRPMARRRKKRQNTKDRS